MYEILYADCPWEYADAKSGLSKLGGKSYPTMPTLEMSLLPLDRLMASNSLCWLWGTWPLLEDALAVIRGWQYKQVTVGIVWIKLNRNGAVVIKQGRDIILQDGVYSGLGSYVCGNSEFCLIGKRGKGVPRATKSIKQILFAPLSRHSAKPVAAYERIEELYPQARKLELFARTKREGWTQTGYDFDGKSIKQFLTEQGAYEGREDHSKDNGGRVEQAL